MFNSGLLPPGQATIQVPTLPGGILYANLLTEVNGAFTRFQHVAFTAASGDAHFSHPLDGQTNIDTTMAITWSTVQGAQGYKLVIGRALYGADLVNSGVLPATTSGYSQPKLPGGATLHATIFTEVRGTWVNFQAITFTTAPR